MKVIKIALPGYNAETDTTPDHFSLYSTEDWVLIKECIRGTRTIALGHEANITHNLGYIPFFLVYAYDLNGRADANAVANKWKLVAAGRDATANAGLPFTAFGGTNNILITNNDTTTTFKYYIFYDQQI